MSNIQQNLIHAVILAAVVSISLWLYPQTPLEVKGILLPSGAVSSQHIQPQQVSVLQQMPFGGRSLGLIRTSVHFDSEQPSALDEQVKQSVDYVKHLAAEKGANAIVIHNIGRTGSVGPLDSLMVTATAVSMQ